MTFTSLFDAPCRPQNKKARRPFFDSGPLSRLSIVDYIMIRRRVNSQGMVAPLPLRFMVRLPSRISQFIRRRECISSTSVFSYNSSCTEGSIWESLFCVKLLLLSLQFRHYLASPDGCTFACILERRFCWAGVKLLG